MSRDLTDKPTKYMPCKVCMTPVLVSKYCSKLPRCDNCAVTAMTEAIWQQREKSGPYYDRWLERGGNRGRPKGRGGGFNKPLLKTRGSRS